MTMIVLQATIPRAQRDDCQSRNKYKQALHK